MTGAFSRKSGQLAFPRLPPNPTWRGHAKSMRLTPSRLSGLTSAAVT